jgi:hypothetical protein
MPKRPPLPGGRVGDYLFNTPRLFRSPVYIATPSLLVEANLAATVRFDESFTRREDIEWLIRAQHAGAELAWVEAPLTVVDGDVRTKGASASRAPVSVEEVTRWAEVALDCDDRWRQNFLFTYGLRDVARTSDLGTVARLFGQTWRLRRPDGVLPLLQAILLLAFAAVSAARRKARWRTVGGKKEWLT